MLAIMLPPSDLEENDSVFWSLTRNGSGHSLASQVLASVKSYKEAFQCLPRSDIYLSKRRISWVRREAAKLGWVSLNTDGVVSGVDGLASDGGVIRDLNGQWIAGFVANFRKASVEVAEFKALLEGLRLARSLGLKNLFVQSDNCSVVKSINREHVDSSVFSFNVIGCEEAYQF
ncbi:hypothetical protein GH714_033023 [Hevea brasiliensis]|uniref:RNase H type-1 domain-containing protein n=1 Tax=Hevea brasiliensis TaxID=3981 RepID=A0A6A6NE31_HEVBR|nr:hypothetical protein GH714_033023 [Hevea brasiliensis]